MHPLHSDDLVRRIMEFNDSSWRGTGRTTALAFDAIAKALAAPRVPIELRDHFPGRPGEESIKRMVLQIIHQVGLKYMTVSHKGGVLVLTFGDAK